jgi:hypothetical protein
MRLGFVFSFLAFSNVGCLALASIDSPTLREDAEKNDAGNSVSAEAAETGDAALLPETSGTDAQAFDAREEDGATRPYDEEPDGALCVFGWSICTLGTCSPNDLPMPCTCNPTCACLESVENFSMICTKAGFTSWSCVDMPTSAQVTCSS